MTQQRKTNLSILACLLSLALVFGVGGMTACSGNAMYTLTDFGVFDTYITCKLVWESRAEAEEILAEMRDLVRGLHMDFNIYLPSTEGNNLKTINDHAGEGIPVAVSQDVISLLQLGREVYDLSEGRVNIAMGRVLSIWYHNRQDGEHVPSPEMLQEAAQHANIQHMVIDEANATVTLTDPLMSLDVGAIAKGYVCQKLLDYAKSRGVTNLLVDFGGQVMALGCGPDGQPWQVGVRDPHTGGVYQTLSVSDSVVVTSGVDQRNYTVDGVTYHHIISPDTLMPANDYASVTVVLPLSYVAISDGLSTALFLMDKATGEAKLAEITPEGQGIWINP